MIAAALPLWHFLIGVASLAVPRGKKWLLLGSIVIDAVLISILAREVVAQGPARIVLGGWDRTVGIELYADWVSLSFCGLFLVLAGAVTAYIWREGLQAYFFLLLHLLFGSVLALLFANDLFSMYVILELLTLVSFLLVGYERRPEQLWAGLKYMVFAAFGMGVYLFGVGVMYGHLGTLNLSLIAARIPAELPPWGVLGAALLVTGVAVKAGIFVFSLWLPGAHASAHPAVSALLSGLVIKMGFVVLLRLSGVFPLGLTFLVLGTATGILGAAYAIYTYDLKRLLAFSTLSQIGYLLVGLGAGATGGAVAYAVAHGLFKGLLFLAGGEAVRTSRVRDISRMSRKGIPARARIGLLVGTLGIIGLPPFAGFVGKGLIHGGAAVQAVVGLITLGTTVAFAKLIPLFRGAGTGQPRWERSAAYTILTIPILLFPLGVGAVAPCSGAFSFSAVVKALFIISGGVLLHRFLFRRPVLLPERIFRLEEGLLIIVSGLFLVFALIWFGG